MKFSLDDGNFATEYPMLSNRVRALNTMLRSLCITGSSGALTEDDGGFPRISAVEFDAEAVAKARKILESTRLGQKPKKQIFIDLLLEIDYDNGYLETHPFAVFKDDPSALLQAVHEKSVYLFRSLYGFRKE